MFWDYRVSTSGIMQLAHHSVYAFSVEELTSIHTILSKFIYTLFEFRVITNQIGIAYVTSLILYLYLLPTDAENLCSQRLQYNYFGLYSILHI